MILAKCKNCGSEGIALSSEPEGICSLCVAKKTGRFPPLRVIIGKQVEVQLDPKLFASFNKQEN